MSSLGTRIDPEARKALQGLLDLSGPDGLWGRSIPARRRFYAEITAAAQAAAGPNDRVEYEDVMVPSRQGHPGVRVRIFRPAGSKGSILPGILFIHGGGFVVGSIETDQGAAIPLVEAINAVVVSVDYRLAPEDPHPAPVEDCYTALAWMAENAHEHGIHRDRLAVYGPSAGGGLAACVALLARDRGGPQLALEMLAYPMLDDRSDTPSSHEIVDVGVWDRFANVDAWRCLLGDRAGADGVSPYAAAARATDLTRLPPTYIDVGELDLLRDENIAYATRLLQARVPVELHVYPGGYHSCELIAPDSELGRRIMSDRVAALRRALSPEVSRA